MKHLSALLSSLALLLILAALPACESDDNDPDPDPDPVGTAASMRARINELRADNDQGQLNADADLNEMAEAQADYNAEQGVNSETDGSGDSIAERLTEQGYSFATVAYLFNNGTEERSFNEWASNAAYSGILLDDEFTEFGVGVAQGDTQQWWVVILAGEGEPSNDTVDNMLELLNEFRSDNGAAEFTLDENLSVVAQNQANRNAELEMNSGEDEEGAPLTEQVANTGYEFGTFASTLSNGDAADSVSRWTDEEEERNIVLDDRLEEVGIGVAIGGGQQWWVIVYAQPTAAP